jgi:hypothetical protein
MSDQDDMNLGSRFLEDALSGAPDDDAPRGQTPPEQPKTQEQPRRAGGLQPLIAQKLKQIKEIEARLTDPAGSGAYNKTNEHGNEIFDYVSMQADQAKLGKLSRELMDLKDRDRDYANTSEQRKQKAQQAAREFLNAEIVKVPEKQRKQTGQIFSQIFQSMITEGHFSKANMDDRQALMAVLNQIMDTAYGNALRSSRAAPDARQPAGSYDDGDEDQASEKPADEDDPFTKSFMDAYDHRKQGGKSVAEIKRQAAKATREKGAEQ